MSPKTSLYADMVLAGIPANMSAAAMALREHGFVKIPGAFATHAPALAESVRRHVERRFGLVEADASTWRRAYHGAISTQRFRHTERFAAVVSSPVRAV